MAQWFCVCMMGMENCLLTRAPRLPTIDHKLYETVGVMAKKEAKVSLSLWDARDIIHNEYQHLLLWKEKNCQWRKVCQPIGPA